MWNIDDSRIFQNPSPLNRSDRSVDFRVVFRISGISDSLGNKFKSSLIKPFSTGQGRFCPFLKKKTRNHEKLINSVQKEINKYLYIYFFRDQKLVLISEKKTKI